jgi:hypothetical protein
MDGAQTQCPRLAHQRCFGLVQDCIRSFTGISGRNGTFRYCKYNCARGATARVVAIQDRLWLKHVRFDFAVAICAELYIIFLCKNTKGITPFVSALHGCVLLIFTWALFICQRGGGEAFGHAHARNLRVLRLIQPFTYQYFTCHGTHASNQPLWRLFFSSLSACILFSLHLSRSPFSYS